MTDGASAGPRSSSALHLEHWLLARLSFPEFDSVPISERPDGEFLSGVIDDSNVSITLVSIQDISQKHWNGSVQTEVFADGFSPVQDRVA